MAKKTTKKEKVCVSDSETPFVPFMFSGPYIVTDDFGRSDLNHLRDTLNAVIERLNRG